MIQSHSMPKKQPPKPRFLKHPITKQKLLVLDEFSSGQNLVCPVCLSSEVRQITVVESEYRGGIRYQVISCDGCEEPRWIVLLG